METIFAKIIRGEIPAYKIAENDQYLAFLDVFPLQKGHVLVIPKKHTDFIFDIEDEELGGLMVFAKRVAQAVKKATKAKRVGVAVIGLEVPHAHVHLIPINQMDDMNFSQPKKQFPAEEMQEIADLIKANL